MNATVQTEELRTHFAPERALRAIKKPNCDVQLGFFVWLFIALTAAESD